MADLIPILSRPIGDEINSVDARDLHAALESRADFSTWIRERVAQCDLVKSKDFEVFHPTAEKSGGRPRAEWVLTIESAKHVALMERTERGKAVRAYFIACEKKLRSIDPLAIFRDPAALRVALLGYVEENLSLKATVTEQAETIAELAPKAATYDALTSAPETLLFREAVKILHRTTAVTEGEARALMIKRGWITRLGRRLAPAHYGQTQGYVTSIDHEWTDDAGAKHATPQLRITQKGLARLSILLTREAA